ncbi:cell wall metabolism sensor histidine kinase WalK [Salinibacterium sp. M195]|uniref:sensor histidine kinase n=1 Tax=Salinibacterium sp. M195 TaxID=2583374 RepID=UPI002106D09F|nr:HAMP domain-containing sensor histidine kinase [Salinibacterium sp. M195]
MAILLVLALLVVRGSVEQIVTDADRSLATSDLVPFVADITANPDEKVDDPGTGVLIYVRDPSGEVQVDTLPHDVRKAIDHREPATETFVFRDDEERSFAVAGDTVSTASGTWTVWSARSAAASELALHGLSRVLLIAGIVLLAGFAVASWVLASVALKPVTLLRRKAEEFSADPEATLPVGPARDEISALAETLNTFLATTRASTEREKQMVSDAAHELRTPLAALKTQLELAHADFGNAAALAAQVSAAEASVNRLTSLASNLLELNRLETDASQTHTAAGVLVDEFMGSIDRARLLGVSKAARVEFAVAVANESTSYALGAQAFGRLVDNLLSNAMAAIATDGEVIATLHQDAMQLRLEVHDTGPGMPENFIPIAFDRFSRPDDSRTATTGGSGLGLALVHAIAVAAHGTAALENTESGLRVTVTLPKM